MVSRIQQLTSPSTNLKTSRHRSGLQHTGQDAINYRVSINEPSTSNQRILIDLHGRVSPQPTPKSSQSSELEAAFSINIDEHLLTGELDEDISILNIVA